ncbi:kazrin-like, partial [Mustelus asterias]
MDENKQLGGRIDGAVQAASRQVSSLRAELSATSRRLSQLSGDKPAMDSTLQHSADDCDVRSEELQQHVTVLLREEVSQLQEEVQWLRQMKEMLTKELEDSNAGKSAEILSVTELKVQLAQKETELSRAKEALQEPRSAGGFGTGGKGPLQGGTKKLTNSVNICSSFSLALLTLDTGADSFTATGTHSHSRQQPFHLPDQPLQLQPLCYIPQAATEFKRMIIAIT